jgi:hypothetical protein
MPTLPRETGTDWALASAKTELDGAVRGQDNPMAGVKMRPLGQGKQIWEFFF